MGLDRELTDLAGRAVQVALEDRAEQLRDDLDTIQQDMGALDLGRSGSLARALNRRCAEEIGARAEVVLREFHRVIEAAQAPYSDDLERTLRAEVEQTLRVHEPQVAGILGEMLERAGVGSRPEAMAAMAEARVRTIKRVGVEIETLALAARRASARTGAPSDEELVRELRTTGIPETDAIVAKLQSSAEALAAKPVNLNTCLNDSRIALETLAKAVAKAVPSPPAFAGDNWGAALAHLRDAGHLTERREKGLAGVYTFVSDGSHVPLFTELEMAAFGRRLIVSMAYFLVRLYKGTRGGKAGIADAGSVGGRPT